MTSKRLLSQSQIIKKINSQTKKSYKLFDELINMRTPVSIIKYHSSQSYSSKWRQGK